MYTSRLKGTFHAIPLLLLIISLLFISCGPGKKLLVSQARVNELQQDSANTQTQLTECYSKVEKLQSETASLKDENSSIQTELNSLSTESKLTIADQAKRLRDLQHMIQSQKDVMAKLKNSIADALLNYKTDELSVYTKDGNVYVSLQEKLLFKSGSAVIDPKGKEALKSLAQVLNNTKDITVMIEGHTDNVPIKTNQFKDNWDLSTARATSIVRILTIDNGADPVRILATGRSQFHPVKSNDTVEGRAGNRRTEVILSPDLKELYKLLYQ
ncbi:MAG: OmpA family protein [Prolixibacteraceae bacterium]